MRTAPEGALTSSGRAGPLVLALDLGTSSVRAALFDAQGRMVPGSLAQRTYPLVSRADGQAELDPARVAREAEVCITAALAVGDGPVAGVGVSCFWHSLLGLDAVGAPLTPIITWADSRCRDDAARLRTAHDERTWHAATGCMLRSSFWPAKLVWLRHTQPLLSRRVRRWVSPGEWLLERWCGEGRCAHGMATGTGLYDPVGLDWHAPALAVVGLDACRLNPLSDAPLALLPRLARRWPRLAAAAWQPAIGDGAASNLGAGATRPGVAAVNFGTSAAIRLCLPGAGRRPPFGLFRYRIDAHRSVVGGAISNAGGLRAWCLRTLRLPDDERAIERALAARPGPHPTLRVLPFWMAERAPSWREDVNGVVAGMTQASEPLDLLQAITEATYLRLALIARRLPTRPVRVVVGGGIQRSPQAFQRLADCLGLPLTACDEAETSLRGAAVLALERAGARPGAPGGRVVRPRRAAAAAYADRLDELLALERRIFP